MGLTIKSRPRLKTSYQSSSLIFPTKNLGKKKKWMQLNRKLRQKNIPIVFQGIGLAVTSKNKKYTKNKNQPRKQQFRPLKMFKKRWQDSKNINSFYGNLKKNSLKVLINKCVHKYNPEISQTELLILYLEQRLDVLLFRSGLVSTIYEARQLINHKNVIVNGEKNNYISYIIQPGDLITIKKFDSYNIHTSKGMYGINNFCCNPKFSTSHIWVNSNLNSCMLISYPDVTNIFYPFEANVESFFEFYQI